MKFKSGKYRGKELAFIPIEYLVWVFETWGLSNEDGLEIGEEIQSRYCNGNISNKILNEAYKKTLIDYREKGFSEAQLEPVHELYRILINFET